MTEQLNIYKEFWILLADKAASTPGVSFAVPCWRKDHIRLSTSKHGLTLNFFLANHHALVELYIDTGDKKINKSIFEILHRNKQHIEQEFHGCLEWFKNEEKQNCRIACYIYQGGILDQNKWQEMIPEMIDSMIRLGKALRPYIDSLPL